MPKFSDEFIDALWLKTVEQGLWRQKVKPKVIKNDDCEHEWTGFEHGWECVKCGKVDTRRD